MIASDLMQPQHYLFTPNHLKPQELLLLQNLPCEASFTPQKVILPNKQTLNSELLHKKRIQIRGNYLVERDSSSSKLISAIKLDYRIKFKRVCLSPLKNPKTNTITQEIDSKKVIFYFPDQLIHSHYEQSFKSPLSQNYSEIQLEAFEPSLLDFFQTLKSKQITEKVDFLNIYYKPLKKINVSKNVSLFLSKQLPNGSYYYARSYPIVDPLTNKPLDIDSHFNLAIKAQNKGVKTLQALYQSGNTFYQILMFKNICTLSNLVTYGVTTLSNARKVVQQMIQSIDHLLSRGIELYDMRPDSIIIQKTENKTFQLFFLSFMPFRINKFSDIQIDEMNPEYNQHLQYSKNLHFRNVGLLLYYMLTKNEDIFSQTQYNQNEFIQQSMKDLQFPQFTQRFILVLLNREGMDLETIQLLDNQFFLEQLV